MKAHNEVPRPGPNSAIPDEVRFDGKRHYPAPGPVRKCVLCKKNCRNVCEKCSKSFHTKLCLQLFCEKQIFDLSAIIVYLKAFEFTD